MDGPIEICSRGFHACLKLADCFSYYSFDPKNKVAEVELWGKTDKHDSDSKLCASNIKIVKELSWQEVLDLANNGSSNTGYGNSGDRNSGDRNSGYGNSGDRNSGYGNSGYGNSGDRNSGYGNSGNGNSGNGNSGDRNSGDMNSGDRNSGDRNSGYGNSGNGNSGDMNSGDRNSGFFNTNEPNARMFNKETTIKISQINMPNCMFSIAPNEWVPSDQMTKKEKKENPSHETVGGYLKTLTLKEAAKKALKNITKKDKEEIKALPNFDSDIFFEITGVCIK